jgi:hypothetical protein
MKLDHPRSAFVCAALAQQLDPTHLTVMSPPCKSRMAYMSRKYEGRCCDG